MQRAPVRSRSLQSVGYDPEAEALEVEFRSGRVYVYSGVPAGVHEWLVRVADKGSFFNRMIRDRYPWRDVTVAAEPDADLSRALRESLTPPE